MEVGLFVPCFIDQFYPQIAENTVKILKKAGVGILYNPAQSCCGQPAFNAGYWNHARKLAHRFLKSFDLNQIIVTPSASCAAFVRNYFSELIDDFHPKDLSALKIYELTDFLVNQLQIVDFGAVFEAEVTYHDACSALREYGIREEPRILLGNVKGLSIIEMDESDVCCGFGGTFAAKFEALSVAMVQQKIENALKTGAGYIVTTEASCLINMNGFIERNNLNIKGIHVSDILASRG